MERLPDWRQRLKVYLASVARTPFQEGRHDCAIFAFGAVAAMTGVDILDGIRGRYTTTRGGLRILRRLGHADHVALAAAHLRGKDRGEAALAGDLATYPTDTGPALAIVQGTQLYAAGAHGLLLVPTPAAALIFEV